MASEKEQPRGTSDPERSGSSGPPAPLSDDLMADWVDGRVTADQLAALHGRADRAALEERIALLRGDSAVLRSIPVERAPAGLSGRILKTLDPAWQEAPTEAHELNADVIATIGLQDAYAAATPVRLRRSGTSRRWYVTGAIAAGLALATTLMTLRTSGSHESPSPTPVGPIANSNVRAADSHRGDESRNLARAEQPTTPLAKRGVPEHATDMATDTATVAAVASEAFAAAPGAEPAPRPLAKSATSVAAGPIDADRAIELARQGRLVVRVRAKDTRALAQLERQGRMDGAGPWKLRTQVPPAVIAAVIPPQPTSYPPRSMETTPQRTMAGIERSTGLIAGMMSPMPSMTMRADDPMSRVRGTYLVEFAGTGKALAAVRSAFGGRLGGEVEYEELSDPIDAPAAPTPERVLWWTQPSSEWAPRVVVPLVVEQG